MTIFTQNLNLEPVPGMPATRRVRSDEWHAGTVIRVHQNKKRLVWQRDAAVLVRENDKHYFEFSPNPDGDCFEFSLRKSGAWVMVGKITEKAELALGARAETTPAIQNLVAPDFPGYNQELPVVPGLHRQDLEAMRLAPKDPEKPVLWLTLRDLKSHLSCSHTMIYKMVKNGTLPPPYKLGYCSRWNAHEVDAWILEKCKTGEAVQKQEQEEKYVRSARKINDGRMSRYAR